ncbi:MAG: elongation factor P [Parcubacteria group bacterium]|nr:elongation factor P [Parcubacteria group bacterium]|tara:strand:+ start:638 stop:1216 length:579 start_codon:yes stop_codon:yes gene_type:complete
MTIYNMAKIAEISNGRILDYRGGLYEVVEFQSISPGKGSAFCRTRMKHLETGKVLEVNFKDSDAFEVVTVQRKNMQYLYNDGSGLAFMDNKTYEQVSVPAAAVGNGVKFLKEGQEVVVVMDGERALSVSLPKKVTMKVAKAPDAVKGDSSGGNVTKDVELENGTIVKAPLFIKTGESIVVSTETGDYVERAK